MSVLKLYEKHTGSAALDDFEKEVRRELKLPVTKQLVYYSNTRDIASKKNVKSYQIIEEYNITTPWYTIEIELEDESKVKIHSMFLKEMQSSTFISDMSKMED